MILATWTQWPISQTTPGRWNQFRWLWQEWTESSSQSATCPVHTIRHPLARRHRNWQASSSVDDNILSPEDSTVCVAYRVSSVGSWRFISTHWLWRNRQLHTLMTLSCNRKPGARCSPSSMSITPSCGRLA